MSVRERAKRVDEWRRKPELRKAGSTKRVTFETKPTFLR